VVLKKLELRARRRAKMVLLTRLAVNTKWPSRRTTTLLPVFARTSRLAGYLFLRQRRGQVSKNFCGSQKYSHGGAQGRNRVFSRHRERTFSNFASIMKPDRTRSRKPSVISNSRWLAYATAGAASAFTTVSSTEGAIHYSGPINQWIGGFQHAEFPLDQQGDSIFLVHYQIWSGGYGGTAWFGVAGLSRAAFAGFYAACNPRGAFVSNLERGQLISNQPFVERRRGAVWASWALSCSDYNGQFEDNQVGYIGFRFNSGNGNQYGWARVAVSGIDHPVILKDYAYGDVGDRIMVGQRSSDEMVPEESDDMVPEEGSLGALALGAAGLLAWRKRRSQAAR